MTYTRGILRERSSHLMAARDWAIKIIVSLVGLGLFISEAHRIWSEPFDPLSYAYLLLLAITGILVFLWIWATQAELDLLIDLLDPEEYKPPSTIRETALIMTYGIFLAALLLSSKDPFWYGIIFSIYSVALLPTAKRLNREISTAIKGSRKRAEEDLEDKALRERAEQILLSIDVLDMYYLGRPVYLRLSLILTASLAATGTAWWGRIEGSEQLGLIAYGILLATIIISELWIGTWRCARDDTLRPILAKLAELERADESNTRPTPA